MEPVDLDANERSEVGEEASRPCEGPERLKRDLEYLQCGHIVEHGKVIKEVRRERHVG